ncbi:hypothetical protein KM176_14870 [Pseudooceanicola sp. CBS1P-1]|uniref:Uncharacterized protein n=1 Tax=Pseudooceanicola albus TaxID=2692189 RepID=A0A6L7G4W2_9RHOB|nr:MULTISPECIES: hypothetical protein [Pseudooceanicola]MBT9385151.1 hypothetical protein [Pseudooceanicola endophyticus]MXN18557.1 hypothetical protein [Pseudooceanicola albus]
MTDRLSRCLLLPPVAAALMCGLPDAGGARAGAPPGQILFHCDAAPALCAALYRALDTALSDRAPGTALARASDPLPPGATGLLIRYRSLDGPPGGLRGQLCWQVGPDPAVSGPPVAFTVLDQPLADAMLQDFATALVRASDLPL